MQLQLTDFTQHSGGTPGDHMRAEIQQMGDGKTVNDTTEVIIDASQDQRDIRISDGKQVLKIQLANDYTIQEIYQNDIPIGDATTS